MKKAGMFLLFSTVLLLSGCSNVKTKLEQSVLEKSGILEQEDYQQYQQYAEAGQLNEAGQYICPDSDENISAGLEKTDGKIHVTFADNRYLQICYYTDPAMTTPIDTENCYLNPGDTLYAKVTKCINPNSSLYQLTEYRIIQYADDTPSKETSEKVTNNTFKYLIPDNLIGTEISVIPVGEYPDRNLSMKVYHVDDDGIEKPLGSAGTWFINGNNINENEVKISPIEPYVLKFTYDTDNYFYVDCQPECFTKDPRMTGFVEFWEAEPTDHDMNYQIELHKYLELSLKFEKEAKVSINQDEAKTVKKNKVWNLGNLQYGDIITIETEGNCTITNGDYQHIVASKDPLVKGYRYILKVVQNRADNTADELTNLINVNRVFKVTLDTSCDHGTCIYKLDGDEVSRETQIQEGQELTLTYQITDEDYSFSDGSDGFTGFIHDLFKSDERTITIPITTALDGTTIDPDDYFDIIKKGE